MMYACGLLSAIVGLVYILCVCVCVFYVLCVAPLFAFLNDRDDFVFLRCFLALLNELWASLALPLDRRLDGE